MLGKAASDGFYIKKYFTFWVIFSKIRPINRGIVPIGRTAVSKTDGCEFESCYPCQILEGLAEMLGLFLFHVLSCNVFRYLGLILIA